VPTKCHHPIKRHYKKIAAALASAAAITAAIMPGFGIELRRTEKETGITSTSAGALPLPNPSLPNRLPRNPDAAYPDQSRYITFMTSVR
jgi:hypothetical protein